ncbi:MAG: hypothetical protein JO250_03160 [Armatimonadetes bacterium]|nr:hypothetical protein [Armatimonadota bacterium]
MSLEGVNRQLALVWAAWSREWNADLLEAAQQWSLDTGRPGSLRFQNAPPAMPLRVALSADGPPAYAALSPRKFSLSAPGTASAPWSLEVSGYLHGTLLAVKVLSAELKLININNKKVDIAVRDIRLGVEASLDDADPERPKVQPPIGLSGGMEIEISGSIQLKGKMAVVPPPPGQLPSLRVQVPDADFSQFFDSPGLRANVDLTLTFTKPALSVKMEIPLAGARFGVRFDVPIQLPENFGQLVGALVHEGLPRDWPLGPPQPTPVSAPAPPAALASALYRDNARDIEDGLEAHLPFTRAAGGLRRFSAVLDNVYPPIPAGTIIAPADPAHPPTPTGTQSAGDCAIWTGHSLAAEAFRYADGAKRGDGAQRQEAVRRAKDILAYIRLLFEVPRLATRAAGDERRGLLCRCVLPQSLAANNDDFDTAHRPQEYYTNVRLPADPQRHWDQDNPYVGKARDTDAPTRDSLTGIALGLTLAHQLIADPDVKAASSGMLTDLLTYLLDHAWNYPTPSGPALTLGADGKLRTRTVTSFFHEFLHQLAFLRAGASVNPAAFAARYDDLADDLADAAWLPAWGEVLDPITKYYKFNLDHGCLLLLLLLETDHARRAAYQQALAILGRAIGHHRNAYFQLIGVLADPSYASRHSTGTVDAAGMPLTVRDEIRTLLDEWIQRRNEVPGPNRLPQKTIPPTAQQELRDQYAASPAGFGDYRDFFILGDEQLLAHRALPLRQRPGGDWDFGWQRDPFHSVLSVTNGVPTVETGSPDVEAPGVDYLLSCWMAAHLGLV